MSSNRIVALGLGLATFLAVSPAPAQQAAEVVEPSPVVRNGEQPCRIDEHLSLWLSLEAADRMIAALEQERRDLAAELATAIKALDVLARADQPSGVSFTELNTLVGARAAGRDAITDAYSELQNRLVELDRTLQRRYRQQAALEARIEALDTPLRRGGG